ncbi:hypothetical protein FGO68_gene13611 [Halteria grandinella]|uniref:Uncharacterized protein n=1 Tax=Halteria grandinella TaxID=5974 RepID=A0A8J8NCQ1_HALGN|nr:hypothetical protein FGO68_gene13611 [Halteria grandinella]
MPDLIRTTVKLNPLLIIEFKLQNSIQSTPLYDSHELSKSCTSRKRQRPSWLRSATAFVPWTSFQPNEQQRQYDASTPKCKRTFLPLAKWLHATAIAQTFDNVDEQRRSPVWADQRQRKGRVSKSMKFMTFKLFQIQLAATVQQRRIKSHASSYSSSKPR